jgi:TPR repeat protein
MKTGLLTTFLVVAGLILAGCTPSAEPVPKAEPARSVEPVKPETAEFLQFKARAGQGGPAAQFRLGLAYEEGRGVAKDPAEAVKWYRQAAEQNYPPAQYSLGLCFDEGRGVAKDSVAAMKWYRQAAEQNHPHAQGYLGAGYANGQGVAQDFVEAYAWLSLAGQTIPPAANDRDRLATGMSPEQIFAGARRTKELRAQLETRQKSGGK